MAAETGHAMISRSFVLALGLLLGLFGAGLSHAAPAAPSVTLAHVAIANDFVDMHAGPGRGYPVFHVAEKNAELYVLREKVNWYKVQTLKGIEGWIAGTDLASARVLDGGRSLSFGQLETAEQARRRAEVGFFVGQFAGDSMLSAFAAYRFTRYFAVEVATAKAPGVYSASSYNRLGIRVNVVPNRQWSPYVVGAAGLFSTKPRSTLLDSDPANGVTSVFGGGVSYAAERGFDVRGAVLSHWLSGGNTTQFIEWQVGFAATF